MATNINCPNCHKPVSPQAHTCPHCGTQLHAHNPQSQFIADELTASLPDVVKQFDTSATTNITIAGVLIGFYAGAIFAGYDAHQKKGTKTALQLPLPRNSHWYYDHSRFRVPDTTILSLPHKPDE